MTDLLGERMKGYESHETQRRSMSRLPICVRIDGRAFHTWTRGLNRPFDEGLSKAMIETTRYLVAETHAKLGYTQSDEITLVFWDESHRAEPLFGGKLFKLTSILASMATAKFNSLVPEHVPTKVGKLATFDARIFQVPTLDEAANLILWRWFDARKNSISMAAQTYFSHNFLHKKTGADKLRLLKEKGIWWESYPEFFKYGTFVRRSSVTRELTEAELDRIPEQHRPDGPVTRQECKALYLTLDEISNRTDVLFRGADAELIPEIQKA